MIDGPFLFLYGWAKWIWSASLFSFMFSFVLVSEKFYSLSLTNVYYWSKKKQLYSLSSDTEYKERISWVIVAWDKIHRRDLEEEIREESFLRKIERELGEKKKNIKKSLKIVIPIFSSIYEIIRS